ncbi:hypothetical protein D3C85_1555050 [compost metagenome]
MRRSPPPSASISSGCWLADGRDALDACNEVSATKENSRLDKAVVLIADFMCLPRNPPDNPRSRILMTPRKLASTKFDGLTDGELQDDR